MKKILEFDLDDIRAMVKRQYSDIDAFVIEFINTDGVESIIDATDREGDLTIQKIRVNLTIKKDA